MATLELYQRPVHTVSGCMPYPKFVVQHMTNDRYQVVPVDPRFNDRPVDGGANLGSFESAALLRDQLNGEAAL